MSTWKLAGPSFDASNELLRDVRIISPVGRTRSKTNNYRVRVGVREGDFITYVGTWDQANNSLSAGTSRRVLDDSRRGMRLRDGWKLEVEIRQIGSPSDIVGSSVEFVFDRTGSVSGKEKPMVSSQATTGYDTAEDLAVLINRQKLGERRAQVPLVKETPATSTSVTVQASDDNDATGGVISSTSFTDGAVSVTVTASTTTYVQVVASCQAESSGAGRFWLAIGDGTTDHNEIEAFYAAGSANSAAATSYAGTVTADTTFKIRLKTDGVGGNPTVEDQTISVLAITP